MPTSNRSISAYLGALVLSAGLASPLALADEPVKEDPVASEKTTDKSKDAGASKGSSTGVNKADSRDEADLIEVRVSLPDGRTFTRLEPRRKLSARYSRPGSIPGRLSRPGSGGSDVSVAARGVRGGSNSSSIRTGGGGGGGGGGASSSGGGGGGGSAASGGGASSSSSAALSQSGSSAGKGVFTYGSSEASSAASTAGSSSSGSKAGGGVTTYGSGSSSGSAGSSSEGTGSTSSSSGSTSSSGTSSSGGSSGGGVFDYGTGSTSSGGSSGGQSNSGSSGSSSQGSNAGSPSVPSIGEPTFDTQGNATGGQSVVFEDAGMSAAVIGSRIYFNNVELVVADKPFEVITGTRLEHSSAMMESGRLSSDHRDVLSSFNTGSSSMKLEFEPDTVVTLMMYNPSQNVLSPAREMRTWTVRIR